MKSKLLLSGFLVFFVSCFSDYDGEYFNSPSLKYKIKAKVNRTNKEDENYAYVMIYLYDKNSNLLDSINSRAGDFNKWALGWGEKSDTIILYSSDIGSKGYSIKANKMVALKKITEKINKRAEVIKYNSYK
ncbi:hypothetical protein [uncultured Tenacibaculum sp.]|uniref:hypothetical protein n=1 Tax=uncultured Tenacibaculum sp. TaxID=174713 RepID=UPI00261DB960|nr:hypothetical protein [uncultured Tenacibaculum sp.]